MDCWCVDSGTGEACGGAGVDWNGGSTDGS